MSIARKWIGILLLGVVASISWSLILFPSHKEEIYFLDVGQGDAQVISLGDKTILVDTGPLRGGVVDRLRAIKPFESVIDLVILSHPEEDHGGGLYAVLDSYRVGMVLYNGDDTDLWRGIAQKLEELYIPSVVVGAGDRFMVGGVLVEVLWPTPLVRFSENDCSLVLRLTSSSGVSALFTGDISSKVEKLLAAHPLINADILKVAHHGSKNSSEPSFLNAVSPVLSLIEVGENRYGHPTLDVLARLSNVGSRVLRTDLNGTVRILLTKQELLFSTER